MLNSDYTNDTIHQFYDSCFKYDNQMSKIGVYPEEKIENVLSCSNDTDKWLQFSFPEIVDIPTQKPDIEGIISLHSSIKIISQRVIKTPQVSGYTTPSGIIFSGQDIANAEGTNLTGRKLIIEAIIIQKVIYTADEPNQSVHSAHFTRPFSAFIVIDKDTPLSQKFTLTPYIEDLCASQLSKRSIFKNTTIFIKASRVC